MNREEQLFYCQQCELRAFSSKQGIICSLTDAIPQFKIECDQFIPDEKTQHRPDRGKEYAPNTTTKVRTALIWAGVAIMFVSLMLMIGTNVRFSGLLFLCGLAISILSSEMVISILGLIAFFIGLFWFFIGLAFSKFLYIPAVLCTLGIFAIVFDRYLRKELVKRRKENRTRDLLDLD